jgi:glucokinase
MASARQEAGTTARWSIGIDVGGTKIAGGLVNLSAGTVRSRRQIPTRPDRGGMAVLQDVVALAEELSAEAVAYDAKVRAIGLGIAELVDKRGDIQSAHVIDWIGLPVREAFSHLVPVSIESDVRAAALAEAHFGAGQPYSVFAYISVGTGISSCLVQDRQPFAGSRGNALVLASAPLTSVCDHCGTVQDQILEDVASGPALVARYNARGNRVIHSGQDIMAAMAQGDEIARDVVRSAAAALGNSVGWLVNVLDPDAVVVGGGLGLAGGLYWEQFVASTRGHIWSEATRTLPIIQAGLGTESGLIGAAATSYLRQVLT